MTEAILVPSKSHDLAAETTRFQDYLAHYGLPTENIIASTDERRVVGDNLPAFLQPLFGRREARGSISLKICWLHGDRAV